MQRYDEPGEKTRYFADDDGQDLESLVKRQRYEGAEDIDANLAENIARKATYKWVPRADGQCPLSVCSGFHTVASVVFSTCSTR